MSESLFHGWSERTVRAGRRTCLLLGIALCLGSSHPVLAAERKAKAPRLSAAKVVQKHVSARGGLEAWRAVKTLSLSGKMDAGAGNSIARSMRIARGATTRKEQREIAANSAKPEPEKQVQLPFKLARERPNKSRLEIEFAGKTAVQVYDGSNGWKLRPFLGRKDVEPFTTQEAQSQAADAEEMGDALIDYKARGAKVELEGVEPVDGRDAYKLKLTTKAGATRRVWVDAQTFLDVKVEGVPRRMDGKMHGVFVYQRDFRPVQGLKIPFVLETVVEGYPQSHKIVVEKVAVNPALPAATFAKPKA